MKNFISGVDYDGATYNKLCIKIFIGLPKNVEKELQEFLDTHPVEITSTTQSESADADFSITLTIFYYSEGKPQFIDERWSIRVLTEGIVDEMENRYGITFEDILDTIDAKRAKKM